MVLWIGVDDTDSLRGMCTTFLATEIVRDLTADFDLIGYPRLVRLNPNIPWKTRGNGAICLCVGRGRGNAVVAGSIDGRSVRVYHRGATGPEPDDVVERVSALIELWSDLEADGTDPGLVVLRKKPLPGPLALCCLASGGTAQLISKRPSRFFGPSPRAAGCSSSPTKVRTTMYSLALPRCLARPADSSVE